MKIPSKFIYDFLEWPYAAQIAIQQVWNSLSDKQQHKIELYCEKDWQFALSALIEKLTISSPDIYDKEYNHTILTYLIGIESIRGTRVLNIDNLLIPIIGLEESNGRIVGDLYAWSIAKKILWTRNYLASLDNHQAQQWLINFIHIIKQDSYYIRNNVYVPVPTGMLIDAAYNHAVHDRSLLQRLGCDLTVSYDDIVQITTKNFPQMLPSLKPSHTHYRTDIPTAWGVKNSVLAERFKDDYQAYKEKFNKDEDIIFQAILPFYELLITTIKTHIITSYKHYDIGSWNWLMPDPYSIVCQYDSSIFTS